MAISEVDDMIGKLRLFLARTIDLVLEVTDPDAAWNTPSRYSQAGAELIAEESRRPETGSWPWLVAPIVARSALRVSVEEARGFRAVLEPGTTSYAAAVLCRAVLESSSLAWWLLDPALDSEKRLARSLLYRYRTAKRTKMAVGDLGLGPEEDESAYGELPEDVGEEIHRLGLTVEWKEVDGRRGLVCGEEHWLSYTDRVATLVHHVWPQPRVPYAVLSAVAHAELLGLARNLCPPSDEAQSLRPVPDVSGIWLWHDTYLVLGALAFSAERAAIFLDAKDQVALLQAWKTELDHVLPALRPAIA